MIEDDLNSRKELPSKGGGSKHSYTTGSVNSPRPATCRFFSSILDKCGYTRKHSSHLCTTSRRLLVCLKERGEKRGIGWPCHVFPDLSLIHRQRKTHMDGGYTNSKATQASSNVEPIAAPYRLPTGPKMGRLKDGSVFCREREREREKRSWSQVPKRRKWRTVKQGETFFCISGTRSLSHLGMVGWASTCIPELPCKSVQVCPSLSEHEPSPFLARFSLRTLGDSARFSPSFFFLLPSPGL